ncbi:MAG TPA: 50S ribosomal protein L4 [Candidatus Bathyarchaeia archaeon]|nr:50S ribosomal protein L4 [Candidatus Bathyarchaeia archaeon]
MTTKIFDLKGASIGKAKVPRIFSTPLRPDVIKRAVVALQTHRIQPQGRDPMAGKRTTAESQGVGLGIARVPRQAEGNRARFAPGTVSGRAAFPPRVEKKIRKKIPKKEMKLALRSAIAATASKEVVANRGHAVEDVPDFPLVVTDDIQKLKKTKEVEETLTALGVLSDIYRVKESRKVRAGKGKARGRKMKQAVGPLLVIDKNDGIAEAARNLPGVEVITINDLNVESLAPGTHPGRLTIWTNSAFESLSPESGGKP